MDFSVIIINYNLTNEIINCINSLIQFVDESDFEIILVDNHSEDESFLKYVEELLKNKKVRFTFIRTEQNIGFGNACNLGVKKSDGDILLFLNPDTIVINNIFPIVKHIMIRKNSDNESGIFGLNVNENKFLDFSAGYFPNYFFELLNVFSLGRLFEAFFIRIKSIILKTKLIKVGWVMGAALLIKKNIFEQVDGFDPDFFLYFEEMDLCKRVILKGLNVNYLSDIKIEHLGSAGSKKNYYFFTKMFYKGKLLFLKKHSGRFGFSIYKMLMFLHIRIQIIIWGYFNNKNREKSISKIEAFKEILNNLNYPGKISNNY
jgi:O-antigen biosynthesis protein